MTQEATASIAYEIDVIKDERNRVINFYLLLAIVMLATGLALATAPASIAIIGTYSLSTLTHSLATGLCIGGVAVATVPTLIHYISAGNQIAQL